MCVVCFHVKLCISRNMCLFALLCWCSVSFVIVCLFLFVVSIVLLCCVAVLLYFFMMSVVLDFLCFVLCVGVCDLI